MHPIQVRIVQLGNVPHAVDFERVRSWRSKLFVVKGVVERFELRVDSDLEDWAFSDALLFDQLPERGGEQVLVGVTNVPLQDNYHTRRVEENVVVYSYHEIGKHLRDENIPLENGLLRLLYSASIVYPRAGGRIPRSGDMSRFAHDETRGCVFDMTGVKEDIIYSCAPPALCSACFEASCTEHVSSSVLEAARREFRGMQKPLFYRVAEWVRHHPLLALLLSSIWALGIGVLASLATS